MPDIFDIPVPAAPGNVPVPAAPANLQGGQHPPPSHTCTDDIMQGLFAFVAISSLVLFVGGMVVYSAARYRYSWAIKSVVPITLTYAALVTLGVPAVIYSFKSRSVLPSIIMVAFAATLVALSICALRGHISLRPFLLGARVTTFLGTTIAGLSLAFSAK